MKIAEIKTPVSSIAGIGPQLTRTLAKVNVFTTGDLLQYYPRDYEDRTQKITFKERGPDGKVHTVALVSQHEWFGYGKMKTLKIIVNDGSGSAELICFNRAFLEKSLIPGTLITLTGKFEVKYGHLQSSSFEAVKMEVPEEFQNHIKEYRFESIQPVDCGVIPVYPLTEGLTQKASPVRRTYGGGPDVVEVRGIEPLSENPSSQLSPSAVCLFHSLARRGQTRSGSGSFMFCVAPLKALRDSRSPHFSTPCPVMRYHGTSTSCIKQLQQRIRCQLFLSLESL